MIITTDCKFDHAAVKTLTVNLDLYLAGMHVNACDASRQVLVPKNNSRPLLFQPVSRIPRKLVIATSKRRNDGHPSAIRSLGAFDGSGAVGSP